ncbi:MAG TPA: YeeE/YedE thiosulfate transporter family protein [Gemmatimonadaceae bacterium]|nr:YeeE/YedE thiosulfate transporter family protein [Gemmatimonadaceae bacterium]
MNAPLYETGALTGGGALAVALGVGVAFGFFLERAGLGSARKLSAQFRLTDLTVLKVMFTAIVTASLGVFWLSRLGALDLARVYVPETYLLPQLVGGAIFGGGLVIAGLCPGTACVSAATGRFDGVAVIGGLLVGILAYGAMHPIVERLAMATPRGTFTLPQLLGAPHGATVLLVVLTALAAFRGAEWLEARRVVDR